MLSAGLDDEVDFMAALFLTEVVEPSGPVGEGGFGSNLRGDEGVEDAPEEVAVLRLMPAAS